MAIEAELAAFYQRHGFGDVLGARPRSVRVFVGCLLVPLPNIEARRRYLKYHDLHHLITGYSVGRIGEAEISAWELGTESALVSPLIGLMNLVALSTGLILEPGRVWRAFLRGRRSHNLYAAATRADVDAGRWPDVAALRLETLEARQRARPVWLGALAFAAYAALSLVIHGLLALPALLARVVTDLWLGLGVFEAARPKPRSDLY